MLSEIINNAPAFIPGLPSIREAPPSKAKRTVWLTRAATDVRPRDIVM
jgi:hypothetical protein